MGDGMLVTVFVMESIHPFVVLTFSFTACETAVPANVCVIFGLPGKLIVTRAEPSLKSQIHWSMYDENPVGTND